MFDTVCVACLGLVFIRQHGSICLNGQLLVVKFYNLLHAALFQVVAITQILGVIWNDKRMHPEHFLNGYFTFRLLSCCDCFQHPG